MSSGTIVLVLIGLLIAGVIAYLVMGHLKGKVELSLPATSFAPGDAIKGSFTLLAKKPIEGNQLLVTLTAREKIESRDSEGKRNTRTRELYRSEVPLEGARSYSAGFSDTYAFELGVPGSLQDAFAQSTLGQAISFMSNERRRIEGG